MVFESLFDTAMKQAVYNLIYRLLGWYRLKTKNNFGDLGIGNPPIPTPQVQGAVWEVLQPSGQWDVYLPRYEYQRFAWGDTMACVTYSLFNCLETLLKRVYNEQWDFSDRFTAKMSNTTRAGNYSGFVFNSFVYNHGFVSFPLWENKGTSWEEFYKDIPTDVTDIASGNKKFFDTQILWLESNTPDALKKALQYSPVWISIFAYGDKKDGVYQNPGNITPTHRVMLYGYDEQGNWKIYDHYLGAEHRLLAPDYTIHAPAQLKITKR